MRESKVKKIGQLISDFIDKNQSNNHMSTAYLLKLWGNLMGSSIMSETKRIYLKDNTLYIKINNPYLRRDLIMQQDSILAKMQTLNPLIYTLRFN